jgi:hypothetical protein
MIKPLLATILVGSLFGVSGCTSPDPVAPMSDDRPRFEQAPGDGNGTKFVLPVDLQFPAYVTCASGATLDMHLVGFVQIIVLDQPNAHHVLLHQLHLDFTYSNTAGETFVWREVSWDHISLADNGDLIDHVAGRNGFDGIIGRIVFNVTTGEVTFEAGNHVGTSDDQACAALD